MSEYQYYEFRTVDRSLTDSEIEKLEAISSRAEITATSFTNSYSYGSFRGDPDRMMEQYFDVFVNVANWGTRHFMVRVPVRGVDLPTIEAYVGGGFSFWIKDEFVILSLQFASEGGGEWVSGEEWMPELIALREELLNGDVRSLYLGWLSGIDHGFDELDDDETEPPVPSGLRTLTDSQSELASFLQIRDELLEVAAERSADRTEVAPTQTQLVDWINSQPAKKRDAWLLALLGESAQTTRSEVLLQFRLSLRKPSKKSVSAGLPARSCAELREAAEVREAEAERLLVAEADAKKARAAKHTAKVRNVELDQLAQRVDAAWVEADQKISMKQPKQYDLAAKLLIDLRDLAVREKQTPAFKTRLLDLTRRHAKKTMMLDKLTQAGLSW